MQYREPINVSDLVRELRRVWVLPLVVGLAMGLLFGVLKTNSGTSFEQRVDVVGVDVRGLANAIGAPDVVETFNAEVVARREQSKLDAVGRQSGGTRTVRVQASEQTAAVSVFARASTPAAALDLAESYAGQIVDAQRVAATARLVVTREQLESELTRVTAALDAVSDNSDPRRVLQVVDESAILTLLSRLTVIEKAGGGGVRDPEVVGAPLEIRRSSLGTYAALGFALGIVLGGAFVVLRRVLSSAVYSEDDLARYGSDIPVLADISNTDRASKGVFAALASACVHGATPGRVPGVLFIAVGPNSVPDYLPAGVLEALPTLGIAGSGPAPEALAALDVETNGEQFRVVVDDDGIRESSSAITGAGRLASTVVVVRRRRTSIASTLEAIDMVRQADGQLRGVVIVD